MDRGFIDKYPKVHPEQTPEEIMLLGMLRKIKLKPKLFRPDSLDSYPKLSKINPDRRQINDLIITSPEPPSCLSL